MGKQLSCYLTKLQNLLNKKYPCLITKERTCSKMGLYKYFKRVDDDNLPDLFGSLPLNVPSKTISEMNKQVNEVLGKKRGEYNKIFT